MKKILFVVNTYRQLIVSMQIREQHYLNDYSILILTDNSNESFDVYKRIKEIGLFDEIHYVETKKRKQKNLLQKVLDYLEVIFDKDIYGYLNDVSSLEIDELFVYNYYIDIVGLFSKIAKYNKNITISFFEEGLSSYNRIHTNNFKLKLINFFRKVLKRKTFLNSYKDFYCYYPELYMGELNTIKLDYSFKDSNIKDKFKYIFNIQKEIDIENKYILLTSIGDFENKSKIGEYELACKIREVVGKDKLIIKQHPRDVSNKYKDNGFCLFENNSVPFEIMQLVGTFKNITYLSVSSGGLLIPEIMYNKELNVYYLFKLCNIDNNKSVRKTTLEITDIISKLNLKNYHISANIEEIQNEKK